MIGVALIYCFTASLGKIAIEHSSPLFFAVTYFIALTVFFAPIAFWMGRKELGVFLVASNSGSLSSRVFFLPSWRQHTCLQ